MAGSLDVIDELLKLAPGRVRTFLDVDFDGLRQRLEAEAPAHRHPIVLLQRIEAIPTASQLINHTLQAMATTARSLWPVWFSDIDFGLGRSSADRAAARLRLSTLREVRGFSVVWGRRAILRAMDGRLPLVSGFPRGTQIHQLGLAISRTGLVLVIAINTKGYEDGKLASFANAARWLAENARLAVAVLLSSEMEDRPGLAHILYEPVRFLSLCNDKHKQQSGCLEISLDCETPFASPTIWVWLGEGRTHPRSEGEAKLAKALANDPELGALFTANQAIRTAYNNQPKVDLLWTQGRVVVEVDGDDHREACKFAADRRRDFELQISDYAVLRLINHEVLTDTAKAISQIREFVSHRRKTRPDLVRHA